LIKGILKLYVWVWLLVSDSSKLTIGARIKSVCLAILKREEKEEILWDLIESN